MEGLTAVVLRRIAAALAGARYPTDTQVTVVVTKEAEPRVAVCATAKEVRAATKEFGGAANVHVIKNCVVPGTKQAHDWQMKGVEVVYSRVRRGKEETRRVPVDTGKCDALFWSASAVEKFMVPHYTGVYGPEHAARLLTAYDTSSTDTLVHDRLSQYSTLSSDPTPP